MDRNEAIIQCLEDAAKQMDLAEKNVDSLLGIVHLSASTMHLHRMRQIMIEKGRNNG